MLHKRHKRHKRHKHFAFLSHFILDWSGSNKYYPQNPCCLGLATLRSMKVSPNLHPHTHTQPLPFLNVFGWPLSNRKGSEGDYLWRKWLYPERHRRLVNACNEYILMTHYHFKQFVGHDSFCHCWTQQSIHDHARISHWSVSWDPAGVQSPNYLSWFRNHHHSRRSSPWGSILQAYPLPHGIHATQDLLYRCRLCGRTNHGDHCVEMPTAAGAMIYKQTSPSFMGIT